ncbi:uncharacterized protein LOC142349460 isoform X3 [Convolutriloba macropyga]|uniref:uncharacterized protein LOC142349460 isoform X3 n=1 Tax=Convolutriloba macropyga TaxID=536237 RepID=UPI003F523FA0
MTTLDLEQPVLTDDDLPIPALKPVLDDDSGYIDLGVDRHVSEAPFECSPTPGKNEGLVESNFGMTLNWKPESPSCNKEDDKGSHFYSEVSIEIDDVHDPRAALKNDLKVIDAMGNGDGGIGMFAGIETPIAASKGSKLIIKTDPMLLSCSAIMEYFEKFGQVLNVSKYSVPTGEIGCKIELPGHFMVEFGYDLGLNAALRDGKVQIISTTFVGKLKLVSVKLFQFTDELENVIKAKTKSYRERKLREKAHSLRRNNWK